MRTVLVFSCLVLVATTVVATVNLEEYGTKEERKEMISAAIQAVKSSCVGGCEEATSQRTHARKRPSKPGKKLGTAQRMYEDMVRTAERMLIEKKRESLATSQDARAKAEALAEELFQRPGSLLTADEIAEMWQESGCEGLRYVPSCSFPTVFQFRTISGVCNNLENPLLGAARTAFSRLTPPVYEDGISSPRGFLQSQGLLSELDPFQPPNPSARLVSSTVIEDLQPEEVPFSHVLMQWGQFLDHDLTLSPFQEGECSGCTVTEVCNPIRVPKPDAAFGVNTDNNANCLPTQRSLPVCETEKPLRFNPREQINELTSFIDASMIYGSEDEIAMEVRNLTGGLLKTGPNFPGRLPSLPIDDIPFVDCLSQDDCFLCPEVRCNEQFALTVMHTIWLREHNRCAKEMAEINPHWDDERLYQECRMIVGALIQKITYVDYLPKILGYPVFHTVIGPYKGYNPEVDPSVPNSFGAAAYRYGHTLIRPQFDRLNSNFRPLPIGPLKLADAFFSPDEFRTGLGTDPIVRGWLVKNSLRVDEFLNSVLTSQLFSNREPPGTDLAALNIHRGRDHGLAPYPVWKNFCDRVFNIRSEFENSLTVARFLELYGSLDTLDLFVGGLAEERLPESLLGATFACLFGLTFQKVRDGDRFWYSNPGVFTPGQLAEIQKGTLSRVFCDNSDNIRMIQPDAFLTNQTRVRCRRLPQVNLDLWKEVPCYARVRVEPRGFPVDISTLSRSVTPRFVYTNALAQPSPKPLEGCIQIQCPERGTPTDLIVFSTSQLPPSISAGENLPKDLEKLLSVYRGTVSSRLVNRGRAGLFSSLNRCESSSRVAFTFSYTGQEVSKQNVETNAAKMELPTEVLEILRSAGEKKEEAIEESESSQEDLLAELEEAIQKLY